MWLQLEVKGQTSRVMWLQVEVKEEQVSMVVVLSSRVLPMLQVQNLVEWMMSSMDWGFQFSTSIQGQEHNLQ